MAHASGAGSLIVFVDMADDLSIGERMPASNFLFEVAGHESGQEVKRWRRVIYFPGGWYADIRELPEACAADRFASF
jgi:hypothetical protein